MSQLTLTLLLPWTVKEALGRRCLASHRKHRGMEACRMGVVSPSPFLFWGMNTGPQWLIPQAAILSLVFPNMYLRRWPSCSPAPTCWKQTSPDELHRLGVHGVWRLGFHWALLHGISTLDEGQGCFGIVQGLPKLLHLTNRSSGTFLNESFFF